ERRWADLPSLSAFCDDCDHVRSRRSNGPRLATLSQKPLQSDKCLLCILSYDRIACFIVNMVYVPDRSVSGKPDGFPCPVDLPFWCYSNFMGRGGTCPGFGLVLGAKDRV